MAQIFVTLPDGSTQTYELPSEEGDIAMLGRQAGCRYVVDADSVSLVHCAFTRAGNNYYMTDQHSSNGILVNGERVERTALVPEVPYQLGEVFLFFVPDAPQARSVHSGPAAVPHAGRARRIISPSPGVPFLAGVQAPANSGKRDKPLSFPVKLLLLLAVAAAFCAGLALRHHQETGGWNPLEAKHAPHSSHAGNAKAPARR